MNPVVIRKLHIDLAFTPIEFKWLAEAAERVYQETNGQFQVLLLQDLDFQYPMKLFPEHHWRVIKLNEGCRTVENFDTLKQQRIWGLCQYEDKTIYLVTDRIVTQRAFIHVTIHELLHSIGVVGHTSDNKGIMYSYIQKELPLQFQESDKIAFCEAVGCKMEDIWK